MARVVLKNVDKVYAGGVKAVCDFTLDAKLRVHMRVGGISFISRAGANHGFVAGKKATPAVLVDKLKFFDPATEQAIV